MRQSESGRITFRALFWLAFLAALVFGGFKVIPVYVNNYQLNDYLRTQTPFWLTQRATAETIRKNIVARAADLDLTVQDSDVTVEANADRVHVNVDFSVPVDLKAFTWQIHFTDSSDNRAIL